MTRQLPQVKEACLIKITLSRAFPQSPIEDIPFRESDTTPGGYATVTPSDIPSVTSSGTPSVTSTN